MDKLLVNLMFSVWQTVTLCVSLLNRLARHFETAFTHARIQTHGSHRSVKVRPLQEAPSHLPTINMGHPF